MKATRYPRGLFNHDDLEELADLAKEQAREIQAKFPKGAIKSKELARWSRMSGTFTDWAKHSFRIGNPTGCRGKKTAGHGQPAAGDSRNS